MKRNILIAYLFILPFFAFSQGGWQYLPNAPVNLNSRLDDIYFINDTTGWAVNGNGEIFKTADAGDSWTRQLDAAYYFRTVEFIDDTTGFVGSLSGEVFKTMDAGEHWDRIDQTFPSVVSGVCGISHYKNNMIMVGVWNSPAYVLHSIDSGKTWVHKDMSAFASALVDCWYKTIDTVFVSGRKNGTQSGIILRSVDSGVNWEEVTPTGVPDGIVWKLQFVNQKIGYASVYQGSGTKTHILKTINGGKSYQLIQALNTNIDAEGIGFINEKVGWMGGWSPGMYQTTDGGLTWSSLNHGKNLNRYFILREGLAYAAGESIYRYGSVITAVNDTPQEEKPLHSLDVFPNPVSLKYMDVKLTLNFATMAVLEIYNLSGQYVERIFKESLPAGVFDYKFDLEKLPAGTYVIVLLTNEHAVRKKVIVAKH